MSKLVARSLFIAACIGLFGFSLQPARAQYDSLPTIPSGSISIQLSNQSPKQGETVRAQALSSSVNLDQMSISWYINGKAVYSGRGATSYSFTAGPLGSNETVTVRATGADGTVITQSASVQTAEVDIIWEASSYVPPFYEGKSLYPYQGEAVVAAIPHFSSSPINPKNFIYQWKVNGTAHADLSGYGKDSIVVTGSVIVRPVTVDVTVSSADGTVSAHNSITLTGESPRLVFYEDSPLYGTLYNRALGNFQLKNKEIKLRAVPYFFSASDPFQPPQLSYSWSINDTTVSAQNNGTESLVLRRPDNVTGQSNISLHATNNNQILQFADLTSAIYFSAQQ